MINYLDWDSNLFGYKVGKTTSENFLKNNDFKEFKLIYIFNNNICKEVFENLVSNGCCLVDKKTELILDLNNLINIKNNSKNFNFKFLDIEDYNDDLLELTFEAGKYSRFKLDSNFKNEEFKKMYSIWIKNALVKDLDSVTIGMILECKIIGFVVLSKKNTNCRIELISVKNDYQNKGFGTILINKVFEFCKKCKCEKILVATQGHNYSAINFYKKNNFEVVKETEIYHLWNLN